ncbi:hypothetical protein [Marinomonas fungiae]|uniref:hypothetical protein n=1 Tax=Marinomonas fungiae TaxID=1137284 RepID=UPI003A8CAF91
MKLCGFLLLPLIIMLAMGCSEHEQVTGPEVQTIDYIVKAKTGSNLTKLAYKVARTTQTYKVIDSKVGSIEANKILEIELNRSILKYQSQWNQNLADAHSEYLSDEEINSLYYNGKNSPYFEKLVELQSKIGVTMQEKSKDLLTKIVSEAMQGAFKQLPPD